MPNNIPTVTEKKQSIKQRLRKRCGPPVQRLAYSMGVLALMSRLKNNKGAIILMYHSVADSRYNHFIDPANHVPAHVFERQMHFLSQHRQVISLETLIKTLQKGETPQQDAVVITFDDGYLDNLTIAAPILDRYNLPATLFLPTGYIDRGETQWIDQAYTAFRYRSRKNFVWGTRTSTQFDLDEPNQCRAVYQTLCEVLLSEGHEKRRLRLSELYERLKPTERIPRLTMTWNDVRALIARHTCFEIGGHTQEHTDLTSVAEPQARRELADCIQRIKDETRTTPHHFSFCYGRTSETLRHLVANVGFEAACGGQGLDPVVKGCADRYRLPRVAAPPSMEQFDLLTNSVNTGIWRKLGRQ